MGARMDVFRKDYTFDQDAKHPQPFAEQSADDVKLRHLETTLGDFPTKHIYIQR